jgi:pyruvate,orthophosphate dikinase
VDTALHPVRAFEDIETADPGLLGGKGASLVRMHSIGLPVPPGFIVSTEVCREYRRRPEVLDELWPDLVHALDTLAQTLGRSFGDPANPLLVSVRSGAPVSMPGMMDTILDIGLSGKTIEGVARRSGEAFAWETYGRLVRMYGTTVQGIPGGAFDQVRLDSPGADSQEIARRFEETYRRLVGDQFPQDPWVQLRGALEAVLRSWDSPRARRYRQFAAMDDSLGTAVIVQAMVFGNLDRQSGTGVAFTRNPSTGAEGVYGDFLQTAQGEDVVAGECDPLDITALARLVPEAYESLSQAAVALEREYADMCDIEFTVENGRFWLLQARSGQRTAIAAVRIALALVDEGVLDIGTAIHRIPPVAMIRLGDPVFDPEAHRTVLGRGLNASPGAVSGRLALNSRAAEELAEAGEDVILVRPFTSPDDISGFIAAAGVVTAHGGRTSHAAVVARGMNLPAVCGVPGLSFLEGGCSFDGTFVAEGHYLSIDGSTGEVYLGAIPRIAPPTDQRVDHLMSVCDSLRRVPVLVLEDSAPSWADGVWDRAAGRFVTEASELGNVADSREPLVIDIARSEDPQALLEAARGCEPTGGLYLHVDAHWPASMRQVPSLRVSGLVTDREGSQAARLMAATATDGVR